MFLDKQVLCLKELALSSRVVAMAWEECASKGEGLNIRHVSALMDGKFSEISLPCGVQVMISGNELVFTPRPPRDLEVQLEVPGTTDIRELGIQVYSGIIGEQQIKKINFQNTNRTQKSRLFVETEAYVDYNKFKENLMVRTRRRGDRFRPLGMKGKEKKVQDFLVSKKVPKILRDFVPLFTAGDEIIWVGGFRINERVKIHPETADKVLEIQIRPYLR